LERLPFVFIYFRFNNLLAINIVSVCSDSLVVLSAIFSTSIIRKVSCMVECHLLSLLVPPN
jgi:hypothetical protein